MLLVDRLGLPLAVEVHPASPAEIRLIEPLLAQAKPRHRPEHLVYDRATDSDPLRARLAARGVELVCPHRKGQKKTATQDGRALRRYAKRWIVERAIARLQAFRRLVTRFEFYAHHFVNVVELASVLILLERF